MKPSQAQIFSEFEGDNWFKRNKEALERFEPERDIPLRIIDLYKLRPIKVMEVGAANGVRLAAIASRHNITRAVALEVSMEAIRDGSRFPQIEFVAGAAHAIPIEDHFDLIIVNFVFHWIDRSYLLRSVAEIDRLLENGGFVIIGDFYPSNLRKVKYHHLSDHEIYTYKQNYAATFISSGLYHAECLLTTRHGAQTLEANVAECERTGVWLLQKKFAEHYLEVLDK